MALDGTVAWVQGSRSPGWFADWQGLRDLVAVSGRWPAAVAGWAPGADAVNRRTTAPHEGRDVSPIGVMADAARLDLDARLEREEADALQVDLEEWCEFDLEPTLQRCGRAPSLGDLERALGEEPGELAVERWVLEWEERHATDAVPASGRPTYLDWFEPGGAVQIVLLPRPEPWVVPAYIRTYAAAYTSSEVQVALFRRWHERYGAEPVASWGTMQQLVVTRPPGTLEEAWELARAMRLLWPDTTSLPGVTVREHARDLVGLDRWFLHLRP